MEEHIIHFRAATGYLSQCRITLYGDIQLVIVPETGVGQRPKPYGESYDLVTFTWDGKQARNPDWRHLPPSEFEEILNAV